MAFGRIHSRHAGRAVFALARSTLLGAAALVLCVPAFAQKSRVPVENIPQALQDDLKLLQRDEPAPATLFDAQRQADRAAAVVR